jgi:hypothetical protein
MPQPAASLSRPVPISVAPASEPGGHQPSAALAMLGGTLLLMFALCVPLLWLGVPWLVLLLTIATPALILSLA